MISRKSLFFSALAVVALGLALCLGFVRVSRTASAELASLDAGRFRLTADIQRAAAALAATQASLTEIDRQLAVAKPTTATVASAPRIIPPGPEAVQASLHPEIGALRLRSDRLYVKGEYRRLYRDLNLSPDRIAQFETFWVEYRQRDLDLYAVAQSPDEATRKAAETLTARANEEYHARLKEIFGADGYLQFEEYERTRAIRNSIVGALAGSAAYFDVPITQEQARQLTVAAVQSAGSELKNDILAAIDWEKFQAQAQRILSPEQYHIMRHVYISSGYRGLRQRHLENLMQRALAADAAAVDSAR